MIKTQNKNVKISPNISLCGVCVQIKLSIKHQRTAYWNLFLTQLLLLKRDTPKAKHPKKLK